VSKFMDKKLQFIEQSIKFCKKILPENKWYNINIVIIIY